MDEEDEVARHAALHGSRPRQLEECARAPLVPQTVDAHLCDGLVERADEDLYAVQGPV